MNKEKDIKKQIEDLSSTISDLYKEIVYLRFLLESTHKAVAFIFAVVFIFIIGILAYAGHEFFTL